MSNKKPQLEEKEFDRIAQPTTLEVDSEAILEVRSATPPPVPRSDIPSIPSLKLPKPSSLRG